MIAELRHSWPKGVSSSGAGRGRPSFHGKAGREEMATNVQPSVDLADVKTVLELEPKVLELLEAIAAVKPAVERLNGAGYVGADWVRAQIGGTTDWLGRPSDGDPRVIRRAL